MKAKETLLIAVTRLTELECANVLDYLNGCKTLVVKKETNTIEERKAIFKSKVIVCEENYIPSLKEFFDYWSEHNDNGKKMRFEMSKNQPFNIKRRLATWKKNNKNWNNNQQKPLSLADKMKQQHNL
jgi:hypothetical protein